jgi:glucokinase
VTPSPNPTPTTASDPLDASAVSGSPVLALDLGASRIRAAVVLPDGTLVSRDDGITRSADGPRAIIADCVALLAGVRARAPAGIAADLAGIGIAAPGPLDAMAGRVIDTPNLGPAFRDIALVAPIGRALGLPAVLERDTVVALLAECGFGAARGARDAVYMTVSTGVGGAVLADGHVLAGADGLAGELGHLVVDMNGPACGCGGRGHLEALSSGTGLARAAQDLVAAGAAPGLARIAAALLGGALTARDLAAAEEAGDPDAAALMERARRAFAAAMVGVVDVFNPEVIVVGGSLANGQGERLLAPARATIAAEAFRVQAARVRLVAAALGDDVGLVGALGLVGARLPGAGSAHA